MAIGYAALTSNNSGARNTAFGFRSLGSNTTGSYNTASGDYSLAGKSGVYGKTVQLGGRGIVII